METQNTVLSALNSADATLLAPHLELVELPREHRLERRGRAVEFVHFIERGIACATGDKAGGEGVEIGMVGREGFVSAAAMLEAAHSPHDVHMLTAGAGQRAALAALRGLMEQSPSLRRALLTYVLRFLVQVMRDAQTNARATLDARLARWLLMMHDRADGNDLHMTHDRLAGMLGVRRAGVSVAAKKLERGGVISLHRGVIRIHNRSGLEKSSAGAYGPADRGVGEASV